MDHHSWKTFNHAIKLSSKIIKFSHNHNLIDNLNLLFRQKKYRKVINQNPCEK